MEVKKTLENRCIYYVAKPTKHKWFEDKTKCSECDGYDIHCEDYESRKEFYKWLEDRQKLR